MPAGWRIASALAKVRSEGASPLAVRIHRIPAALRAHLRSSFFARGQIPYRYDKILPKGLAVVIFTIGGPHRLGQTEAVDRNPLYDHGWFHGVQTRPVYNLPTGETNVLGLLFEPVGIHALFGIDMRDIADRTVDARQVLPAEFVATVEAALPSAREKEAPASVHAALLDRRSDPLPAWLYDFYDSITTSQGEAPLSQLYDQAGRTQRRVSDRFKKAVGVTPKVLARIYRLGALLDAVDPDAPISWTELAHRFGFFDQAHFNREFQRFSDLSPSRYAAERRRDYPDMKKEKNVHFVPQN